MVIKGDNQIRQISQGSISSWAALAVLGTPHTGLVWINGVPRTRKLIIETTGPLLRDTRKEKQQHRSRR